jgi:arylsulfatase A-like enzyme
LLPNATPALPTVLLFPVALFLSIAPAAAALTNNLELYYSFDNDTSDPGGVRDNSGFLRAGTGQVGGIVFGGSNNLTTLQFSPEVPTQVGGGKCLVLTNTQDYVASDNPGYPGVLGSADRTVACWFRHDPTQAVGNDTFVDWGLNANGGRFTFKLNNASAQGTVGALRVEVQGDRMVGSTVLSDGQWHHLAAVFANDGSPAVTDVKLYVNGFEEPSGGSAAYTLDTLALTNVVIGNANPANGSAFLTRSTRGWLDEVGIWSRALSSNEIASLAAGAVVPPPLINTNLPADTATGLIHYEGGDGNLSLSWPASHLGWLLQSNSVNVADENSWHDISESRTGTNHVLAIDPSRPHGFYRLHAPMNVVLLLTDDWRHDTLGCAGNPVVLTPNLDRLASEGLRFTEARVTTSVCWVSRASIFTGQWMSRHGRTGGSSSITNWADTFPAQLRNHGYWIGHVGKWHNGSFPAADYDFGVAYHGRHWYDINGVQVHVTQRNEDDAMEFLRTRPADKPFLLTIASFAPHAWDGNVEQYLPQPETTNLYVNVDVPVPVNANDASFYRLPPFVASETNQSRLRYNKRFDTPEKNYQKYMKNYYRLCTGVDTMYGRVLDELRHQGVLDNTLVIFIGDNGYFHGEHGLADKWYPHQESIRVPLIVRDPRMPAAKRGQTNDVFALNVDLAPTILNAAGIPLPGVMQGADLAPLYLDATPPAWRADYYYEHPTLTSSKIPGSEALVRKDWKYLLWPDYGTEQLFDLLTDPIEEQDLISDPVQQAWLAALRARFTEVREAAK